MHFNKLPGTYLKLNFCKIPSTQFLLGIIVGRKTIQNDIICLIFHLKN